MDEPGGQELRLCVPVEASGERLDRWLAGAVPQRSRSALARLIREGALTVDGRPARAGQALRGGEALLLRLPEPVPLDLEPEAVDFTLVHEDEHLAVVDKPAGVVVHPAAGNATGTLVQGLLARLDGLAGIGDRLRPGIVHRLDKDTSGLLLVAKTDVAHRALSAMIAAREVKREYLALAWGRLAAAEGEVATNLGRDPRNRKRMAVLERGGKPALTRYSRIDSLPGFDYIRVALETGRTHQIRVHMAHLGHPLLGDPLYGGRRARLRAKERAARERERAALDLMGRQALHAWRLRFRHPVTAAEETFTAPLPADMCAVLALLGRAHWTPDHEGELG